MEVEQIGAGDVYKVESILESRVVGKRTEILPHQVGGLGRVDEHVGATASHQLGAGGRVRRASAQGATASGARAVPAWRWLCAGYALSRCTEARRGPRVRRSRWWRAMS